MKIPYGKHEIIKDDIDSVIAILKNQNLTQGPIVNKFEEKICKNVNGKYGTAVNSATSALHLACLSLGLKPGDLVWTSPITFVATANSAKYCSANVDFVDIDINTYNISIKSLEEKLYYAKKDRKLPKILIPVHMCGTSCEIDKIKELSKIYKFKIIEDASHAIGGKFKNEKIGSSAYSDITVFSFHPVKIITTGEGGIALTNEINLKKNLDLLRSHGITKNINEFKFNSHGNWYYEQQSLGFNYRLTELQAALGLSQLKRLKSYIKRRNEIANLYNKNLKDLPITAQKINKYIKSSYHLYTIRLDLKYFKISKEEIYKNLHNKGIFVGIHYIPIYKHPYYKNLNYDPAKFKNAEKYYKETLSLPIYPSLNESQIKVIIDQIKKYIR